MNIRLIAIGKTDNKDLQSLINDYTKRLSFYVKFDLEIIPDIIILIDGQKDCMLNQFDVNDYMYKDSIILSSIKLDEDLYEKIKNTKTICIQPNSEIKIQNHHDLVGGLLPWPSGAGGG